MRDASGGAVDTEVHQRTGSVDMAGHQRVLRLLLLLILASSTGPRAVADVASGVAWLSAQAQADGSYATANDGTNPFQATAQALLGLAAVGEVDLPSSQPALDFLAVEPYAGTAYAAARVLAFSAYGRPSAGQLEGLRRTANEIGVYAAFPGFSGTVLDSALALEAFSAAGVEPGAPAAQTVGWLLDRQRADGGWSLGVNASDVPVTAAVVRALSPYRDMLVSVSDALSAAQAFLLGRRTAAGGWGEDQATASVLLALLPWTPDAGLLQGDLEILRDHQQPGGSWGGDVYMTALALRALAVADERGGAAVPGPDIGAVKGRVLDVDTGEPVPGASITPEGVPGFEAVTGQDGRFFLGGLPAGEYSLYARKAGYIGSARIGMVREGEVADAGVLAMALAPTAASLDVRVRSSLTGAALPGATVVLTGSGDTYQGISGADGRALLEGIVPAAYQWSISLGGFGTVEGSAVLSAGVVLRLTLGMVAEGAYPDEAPVDLTGRAVDGETGAPLPGALASLDSGPGVGADANGYFVLSDAQRGSHELRLEAPGYTDRLYELDLPPGAGGALGDLPLFAGSAVDLPDSLTLRGRVVDGITGEPVAGALVEPSLGGGPIETDGEGAFDLAGITAQELVLAISAQGHSSRQFTVSVEVFGDVSLTFRLPPQTESPPALASSSIEGTVRDTETGLPLAGARVALDDGSTAVLSGADGAFRLEGIQALSFSVEITALGYGAARYAVELKQHGTYSLPVALDPLPVEPGDGPTEPRLQVLSVESVQGSAGAHGEVRVRAWIGNLEEQTETVQVLAEVVDALGRTVAYVDPVVPGTDTARPELTLGPSETRQLELRWPTAQHPPGAYRFLVRAIEPGSRTAGLPAGRVYAEAEGSVEVEATAAFAGYASLDPPIAQAGQDSPVALSALLVNSGNVPLINPAFRLEVKDPESGVVLAASTSVVPEMVVGAHRELDFGYWVPTQAGDLEVTIVEANGLADGVVEGALHVGDRPVGAFTIAPEVVAEGTHTVRGRIDLRGVDVTQGTVTDPLFLAVRDAVERGGVYVAREAVGWQKRNRCQGCHIQTQSLLGLSSSFEKAPIDREAAEFLYNGVTSALQASGALSDNRPHQLQTQTAFSAWALTEWPAADRT
ncbi:MAG: carboxypeptidase regulatory-like domain-containing protein, partial [Chromatiales bacterium]